MAKSISEFITEQETGVVSTASDNYVQAYCECAAALSLANCYAEHAAIMEFAEENGINRIRIVQEAEDKKNIFKRAGGAVARGFKAFIEFIKSIFGKITGIFKDAKTKRAAAKLSELDPYDEIQVPIQVIFPQILAGYVDKISETLATSEIFVNMKPGERNGSSDIAEVAQLIKDCTSDLKDLNTGKLGTLRNMAILESDDDLRDLIKADTEGGKFRTTVGMYQKLIGDAKANKLDKMQAKINKSLDKFKSMVEAGASDDDFVNGESTQLAPITSAMKEFMNALTRSNEMAVKYYSDIENNVEAVLKKKGKKLPKNEEEPKAKTESFYFV